MGMNLKKHIFYFFEGAFFIYYYILTELKRISSLALQEASASYKLQKMILCNTRMLQMLEFFGSLLTGSSECGMISDIDQFSPTLFHLEIIKIKVSFSVP